MDCAIQIYDESAVVCLAYDLTGDLNYAAFADYVVNNLFHSYAEAHKAGDVSKLNFGFGITLFSGLIPRLMDIVADATDRDAEAFRTAKQEWKKKSDERPERESCERPSALVNDLGRLSTEQHPPPER